MVSHRQAPSQLISLLGDKYEFLRWIGRGGMANVYLLRHRVTGGYFALKVLADHLAVDPRIVERFVQEARTAATLSGHPNVVSIFDVDEAGGYHYIIMQFVAGEDLASMLKRRGRFKPAEAGNLIAQVAEALSWACARGVTHRDLKPSNLMLDRNGRIIVLDFGIAKAADVPSRLTAAGERLGTPYYMSPEQIRGEECDVKSDLYSLGVMFYELLAGIRPFRGDSDRAIEFAHLSTAPADLQALDPVIPASYRQVVERLLQKAASYRYQTPADLLSDLQALGANSSSASIRPVLDPEVERDLSRAPTPQPQAHRQLAEDVQTVVAPSHTAAPSRRWPRMAIAAAVVVLLSGSLYLLLHKRSEPREHVPPPDVKPPLQTTVKDNRTGITFHLVPGGKFVFGYDGDPSSPHAKEELTLPAFYVAETEVSNAQYEAFCQATGHHEPRSTSYHAADGADLPVANVSLDDAEAYALWAGMRIPTEEEWEKAARGTDGRVYPWGSEPWERSSGLPTQLQPISSHDERRSPLGSYYMAGNVFEWTVTHFPAGEAEWEDLAKLLGSSTFSHFWFAIKGGCFGKTCNEIFLKSYMRRGWPRDLDSPLIGFRCVRNAPF